MTMRIAVAGASGRMGRMLIDAVLSADDARLVGALDVEGSAAIGRDAGEHAGRNSGVRITADIAEALADAQLLIDFTRPQGTLAHLAHCAARGIKMVIGTTGFDAAGIDAIRASAQRTAIVFAPNMSVGVNATLRLLQVAAQMLSDGYDIEIIEAHHRHKVDAPSGTALKMGQTIAEALGKRLDDIATWTRHGDTGAREAGRIGFSVIRGGDIVGDHTVMFCGAGERIEITHRSTSRETYAQGSVRACRFLTDRTTGLYDMQDVLGLPR